MATSLSEAEILARFAQVVARSLRIEPALVTPEAYLSDLGAESLDLLEITMEAEEEFNILIPQKTILQTANEVFGEGVILQEGRLTEQGRRFLLRRMPELDPATVPPGAAVADLARAFQRVGTWVRMIQGLSEHTPRVCPSCKADLPKAVAGRIKCASCSTEMDLPSGDDLNRRWVEEYRRGEADLLAPDSARQAV
jgi:acyl carrier protein